MSPNTIVNLVTLILVVGSVVWTTVQYLKINKSLRNIESELVKISGGEIPVACTPASPAVEDSPYLIKKGPKAGLYSYNAAKFRDNGSAMPSIVQALEVEE